jgi:hypothetical protein
MGIICLEWLGFFYPAVTETLELEHVIGLHILH